MSCSSATASSQIYYGRCSGFVDDEEKWKNDSYHIACCCFHTFDITEMTLSL
jgi:hypothetical protein